VSPPSAAAAAKRRYRGRFAPSPSGPLHFGSLVAALASCCDARAAGGEWLLRIEDVDTPRSSPGAEALILTALERYGFEWDGAIVRQSDRTALYEVALEQLRMRGLVYACECTRRELAAIPVGSAGEHVYPGTCSNGLLPTRRVRRQHAWRVRVDAEARECRDRLQATQRQDLPRDVGDFVVKRADGLFAYQLAVVVDDGEQGITDVVRGADLLASTPRQVMLQNMLSLPTPGYLHVPIAINAAGEKLSKQTRAAALPAWPLPALLAAWQFLEQPLPSELPISVAEFWTWARTSWQVARLPPVPMLPAAHVSPVVLPIAAVP
jgi:glutamyl-Q tRNA(Asp) synthetase